jgi:hypothetical protein
MFAEQAERRQTISKLPVFFSFFIPEVIRTLKLNLTEN